MIEVADMVAEEVILEAGEVDGVGEVEVLLPSRTSAANSRLP